MADSVLSPNMGLVIPLVGQEAGPQYAQDINTSLFNIDAHDHSPGSGVQITPQGIDINNSLSMNSNDLSLVRSVQFDSQVAPLPAISPDIENIYVSGVDLYYNDGNGNQVRITQGGSVVSGGGGITGLAPPASATYVSGTSTFVWQSDVNKAANMDMGSIILRKLTTSSPGITISPSSSLSGNYTITLPSALPASQKFVTLDNSGNLLANWAVDNVTLEVASNVVQVKAGGISATSLADHTVTVNKLALMPSPGDTAAVGEIALSASSGNFQTTGSQTQITNFSVTLTTAGRPVRIAVLPDGNVTSGQGSYYFYSKASGTDVSLTSQLIILRDAVAIASISNGGIAPSAGSYMTMPIDLYLDSVPAGTYTYTVNSLVLYNNAGSVYNVGVYNWKLMAYEI